MGNRVVRGRNYKWIVLAISFLMMICFALSLQALPPLFEQINKEIPFSNSQAGFLMGTYAIPGIFLPFLVAYLANRYDIKRLIIIALVIMIAGVVAFSLAGSYPLLVLSRLVAGIGVTGLVVLAPLLVTMFFDQKNIGIAMGIFHTAVPVGTVFAANCFGFLGYAVGWRAAMWVVAGFLGLVLLAVVVALFLPEKEENTARVSNQEPVPRFRGSVGLWLLAAIWVLANFQLLAYMTFGPQYYQSAGLTDQRAGFLTSLIMLWSIVLAPVTGVIFDKTGRKRPYLLIGSLIMLASYVMLAVHFGALPLWAVALGVGYAPIPVFVFTLLPDTVRPHEVGMGMGILTVAANMGTTIGPPVLGALLDQTGGNFTISFLALAAVSAIILALALGLKTGEGAIVKGVSK